MTSRRSRATMVLTAVLSGVVVWSSCGQGETAARPEGDEAVREEAGEREETPARTAGTTAPARSASRPAAPAVPAGAQITLRLDETLSTGSHSAGDGFTASVTSDVVSPSGAVLIPAGSTAYGVITESVKSTGSDTDAVLAFRIEAISAGGETHPLQATVVDTRIESSRRDSSTRTATKIGVGAAAGALVGQILGKDRESTLTGAVVGAAAGTAVALSTRGGNATAPEGSIITIRLDKPLRLQ